MKNKKEREYNMYILDGNKLKLPVLNKFFLKRSMSIVYKNGYTRIERKLLFLMPL